MGKTVIMEHPLIQHKIGILRDKNTTVKDFRELVAEIAMLMAYEATSDLPLEDVEVETPICPTTAKQLMGKKAAVISIWRAGEGMVNGVLKLMPSARVGHIGLYRSGSSKPVRYYCKLPEDIRSRQIFVVDPMLATGGSAVDAITQIEHQCKNKVKKMRFLCIIAAPEGLKALREAHPQVDIYIGALDEGLNERNYIVPGLGDAGDRIYGTK